MVKYTKTALADAAAAKGWAIGDHTYGVPTVQSWGNDGRLSIGKYCSIAGGVRILLGGNHRTDWVSTYPFNVLWRGAPKTEGHPSTNGDVVIGNDVWIGQLATILSGVTIGDGACIATESVVVSDVPPYGIVGGNPAKLIRMRFSPDIIESLERIAWWNWPDDEVTRAAGLLMQDDIAQFIAYARNAKASPQE